MVTQFTHQVHPGRVAMTIPTTQGLGSGTDLMIEQLVCVSYNPGIRFIAGIPHIR